jgi:hypothetical protein
MATQRSQALGRWAVAPSTLVLFIWMIIPLALTIYFSTLRYNLLYPERSGFIGLTNYTYFVTNAAFTTAIWNTLVLVLSVLVITIVLGRPAGAAPDKADLRPRHCPPDGDRAVLHHAHRFGAGLEEPADEPGIRVLLLAGAGLRARADRLVRAGPRCFRLS